MKFLLKPSRAALRLLPLLASLTLATLHPLPAFAAGEGDVFARLLGILGEPGSRTAATYLLRSSTEIKDISRAILGKESAGVAEEELTERAIRKLQATHDRRFAEALEERLLSAESDFVDEMSRDPGANVEQTLTRLAAERFQTRDFVRVDGRRPVEFKEPTSPTRAEKELKDALHADPAAPHLREKVLEVAKTSPELKLEEKLKVYDHLLEAMPDLGTYLRKADVYRQLADEEMTLFTQDLGELLDELSKLRATDLSPKQRLTHALKRTLRGKVPKSSIPGRIRALLAGEKGALRRALGDMTLPEVQELFHGGDPLHPAPDSLLGQYLKETGATTQIRAFEDASLAMRVGGQPGAQGPRRLVISLSKESEPVFKRLFKRVEWMSSIGHGGIVHNGNYSTVFRELMPFGVSGTEYTPIPVVLLKPTEGQRLSQYLRLYKREAPRGNWGSRADSPWNDLPGYCSTTSYWGGCTQYIGNMPIGDDRVIEYTYPSKNIDRDHSNLEPRVAFLGNYADQDPLVRRVWKIPGNRQFGEVIGQQGANLRGELANPGWVISTLLGPTTTERVPFVFVTRPDHRLPIAEGFKPHYEGRH
jgi:hypothetical protein